MTLGDNKAQYEDELLTLGAYFAYGRVFLLLRRACDLDAEVGDCKRPKPARRGIGFRLPLPPDNDNDNLASSCSQSGDSRKASWRSNATVRGLQDL